MDNTFLKYLFTEEIYDLEKASNSSQTINIIVQNKLSHDEKTFLSNVLNAVNVSVDDVSIYEESDLKTSDLKGKTIYFSNSNVSVLYNQNIIEAPSLKSISQSVELKKELWQSLKKLFDK